MRCSTSMLLNSKTGADPGISQRERGEGRLCTIDVVNAPFLWRDLLGGSEPCPPPLPPKKMFPIFLSKTPFPAFLRLEKRCESMLQNLECILFLSQKPKNNNLIKKDSSINNSYCRFSAYLRVNLLRLSITCEL